MEARSTAEASGSEGSQEELSKLKADAEYAAGMLDRIAPGWWGPVDPSLIDNGSATRNVLSLIVSRSGEVDFDDARRMLGVRPFKPRGLVLTGPLDPRIHAFNRIWVNLVLGRKQNSASRHAYVHSSQVPVRARI